MGGLSYETFPELLDYAVFDAKLFSFYKDCTFLVRKVLNLK